MCLSRFLLHFINNVCLVSFSEFWWDQNYNLLFLTRGTHAYVSRLIYKTLVDLISSGVHCPTIFYTGLINEHKNMPHAQIISTKSIEGS